MNQELRKDAKQIIDEAIASVQPDAAVRRALSNIVFSEHVYIVAIGKAGWQMANAAVSYLQENGIKYEKGIVITKYHHVMGQLPRIHCVEAGHPVPDENSFKGTQEVLSMVKDRQRKTWYYFWFQAVAAPCLKNPESQRKNYRISQSSCFASGADIVEMNTIRKRLSEVKVAGLRWLVCRPW